MEFALAQLDSLKLLLVLDASGNQIAYKPNILIILPEGAHAQLVKLLSHTEVDACL